MTDIILLNNELNTRQDQTLLYACNIMYMNKYKG